MNYGEPEDKSWVRRSVFHRPAIDMLVGILYPVELKTSAAVPIGRRSLVAGQHSVKSQG
jgi:hypothetical protein